MEVYVIHQGDVHEGGGCTEIYLDKEKAIKFALMEVQSKISKHNETYKGDDVVNVFLRESTTWVDKRTGKEDKYHENIVFDWSNEVEEIRVVKFKIIE